MNSVYVFDPAFAPSGTAAGTEAASASQATMKNSRLEEAAREQSMEGAEFMILVSGFG